MTAFGPAATAADDPNSASVTATIAAPSVSALISPAPPLGLLPPTRPPTCLGSSHGMRASCNEVRRLAGAPRGRGSYGVVVVVAVVDVVVAAGFGALKWSSAPRSVNVAAEPVPVWQASTLILVPAGTSTEAVEPAAGPLWCEWVTATESAPAASVPLRWISWHLPALSP